MRLWSLRRSAGRQPPRKWSNLESGVYQYSEAKGIDVRGNDVWVAGYGWNYTLNRSEALLWHNVIPQPSSLLALVAGLPGLALCLRRRLR
ncbi:MAG TPA: hypothetical protein VMX94_12465 [Armatimonadota bacterium]|nr:hypothetical protein [Armatimonadota bacterium]